MGLPPADKQRALPVAAKQSSVTVSSMMPLELERPLMDCTTTLELERPLMDCTTTSTVLSESREPSFNIDPTP